MKLYCLLTIPIPGTSHYMQKEAEEMHQTAIRWIKDGCKDE